MAKDMRFWAGMLLLGLLVLFAIQNVAMVEVNFMFWAVRLPRSILLFLTFGAGAILGWVWARAHARRL
ncbi:MAG: LapA family protein [Alphaproteobacteria bacterium]